MTILLSVSALYVVIIGSIPQLGYLTIFDNWIFVMFILLSVCVVGHLASIVLIRKSQNQPLRLFYSRVIEMTGRVTVFPVIVIMYLVTFFDANDGLNQWSYIILIFLIATALASLLLLFREIGGTRKSLRVALDQIEIKLDDDIPTTNQEIICLNFFRFKVFSKSPEVYFSWKKRATRLRAENSSQQAVEMTRSRTRSNSIEDTNSPLQPTAKMLRRQIRQSARNSKPRNSFTGEDYCDSDDDDEEEASE